MSLVFSGLKLERFGERTIVRLKEVLPALDTYLRTFEALQQVSSRCSSEGTFRTARVVQYMH